MSEFNHHVYLISYEDSLDGPIKIGYSHHPPSRLKEIQTGNPDKLSLCGSLSFNQKIVVELIEKIIHSHLKDNNLKELPEPDWSDDPTMAYIYLPTRSLNGDAVRLDRSKARMFPESIVGYLEKGGLMKLPAKVVASKTEEQLPKMETEKPKLEKIKLPKIGE